MCGTSSADLFETRNQPYQNHSEVCCRSGTGFHVLSTVNLMIKMCQVVIQQCEGCTQHKPEESDYGEPFCDFLHQILKVYAPKSKF